MNPQQSQPNQSPDQPAKQPQPEQQAPLEQAGAPFQQPFQAAPLPPQTQIAAPQPHRRDELAIVGFILAFVVSIAGLIVSIIALVKSKRAGMKSPFALWGVIVSSVFLAMQVLSMIVVMAAFFGDPRVSKCLENGSAYVVVDGEYYECPELFQQAGSYSDRTSSDYASAESIVGTPVTVSGSTSQSTCWTLTIPAGYIQSPNASQCQTELRLDNGTSSGASLTSITLKPQIGDTQTVDEFFKKIDEYAASGVDVRQTKKVSIDGRESGYAEIVDGYSLVQQMYFIPDTSGAFKASNGTIISYLLTGPSSGDGSAVESVAASLRFAD